MVRNLKINPKHSHALTPKHSHTLMQSRLISSSLPLCLTLTVSTLTSLNSSHSQALCLSASLSIPDYLTHACLSNFFPFSSSQRLKCSGFFFFFFPHGVWALLLDSRLHQVIFFSFDFDYLILFLIIFSVLFFFSFFFFISLDFISETQILRSCSQLHLRFSVSWLH